MVIGGPLSPLDVITLLVCEPFIEEKMTMRSFKAKGYRTKEVLDLVHTDLCGPMSTSARGGYEYFITFIDNYLRYGYLYLMRDKSEAFEKFKEFKAEVENLSSLYDLIVKANTSWVNLGNSSKIMGLHH